MDAHHQPLAHRVDVHGLPPAQPSSAIHCLTARPPLCEARSLGRAAPSLKPYSRSCWLPVRVGLFGSDIAP